MEEGAGARVVEEEAEARHMAEESRTVLRVGGATVVAKVLEHSIHRTGGKA